MTEMRVVSGPRRFNRQTKRAKSDAKTDQLHHVPYMERCELDSHADTVCAGRNCRLLSCTPYRPLLDVPVATVATAITSSEGVVYILIFNEVLYFGDSMDHTLINPN